MSPSPIRSWRRMNQLHFYQCMCMALYKRTLTSSYLDFRVDRVDYCILYKIASSSRWPDPVEEWTIRDKRLQMIRETTPCSLQRVYYVHSRVVLLYEGIQLATWHSSTASCCKCPDNDPIWPYGCMVAHTLQNHQKLVPLKELLHCFIIRGG